MRTCKPIVAILFAIVSTSACGAADDTDRKDPVQINNGGVNNGGVNNGGVNNGGANNGGANNGGANNGANTTSDNVKLGLSAPDIAKDAAEEILDFGAAAVFEASIQANGGASLVVTGTLTQNGQQFTYSAMPNDRLRIAWSEGPPTDFFVTAFDGDFSGDSEQFTSNDHVVAIRAVRDGVMDLTLESQQSNDQRAASLVGELTMDGVAYQVDIGESGTVSAEVGSGNSYESDTTFRGTIVGSDGFSQDVQERFVFKLVNDVSNDDRQISSQWTANGHTYTVADARIRFEQIEGRMNFTDFWIIQGAVLEDGVQIGEISYELTEIYLSIFVQIGTERIELYRFTA